VATMGLIQEHNPSHYSYQFTYESILSDNEWLSGGFLFINKSKTVKHGVVYIIDFIH
jgi:hypothetical protein